MPRRIIRKAAVRGIRKAAGRSTRKVARKTTRKKTRKTAMKNGASLGLASSIKAGKGKIPKGLNCLLYTSPSPRD